MGAKTAEAWAEFHALQAQDKKRCSCCKAVKKRKEFYNHKSHTDGKSGRCKACEELSSKRSKHKFAERIKKDASLRRLRKYNLTLKEFQALVVQQAGRCAICRADKPDKKRNRQWLIDHDHNTGKVRGLLCHNCNVTLGLVQDSVLILESMIRYLNLNN